MKNHNKIMCIGEILWDALPEGLFLGGAPLNVSYHLNQLGISSDVASKIGGDRLGEEAIKRIERMGISADLIQSGNRHETGFVEVTLNDRGEPEYEIVKPAAWDYIEVTDLLEKRVGEIWGLVFGTLAQRSPISRQTIQRLWHTDVVKILDLNLRFPHVDRHIVEDSLNAADVLKMNAAELEILADWYSIEGNMKDSAILLSHRYSCPTVCITKGDKGSALFMEGNWYEHEGYTVDIQDTVGSGDAFLAAFIYAIQNDINGEEILRFANAAGALVVGKSGATPEYLMEDIGKIM